MTVSDRLKMCDCCCMTVSDRLKMCDCCCMTVSDRLKLCDCCHQTATVVGKLTLDGEVEVVVEGGGVGPTVNPDNETALLVAAVLDASHVHLVQQRLQA